MKPDGLGATASGDWKQVLDVVGVLCGDGEILFNRPRLPVKAGLSIALGVVGALGGLMDFNRPRLLPEWDALGAAHLGVLWVCFGCALLCSVQ